MEKCLIVAVAQNRVIGNQGSIPWYLPGDLARFKSLTTGHAVIMGKNTWRSLPKKVQPLPGRMNIIVSKTIAEDESDFWVTASLAEAFALAERVGQRKAFVIGGARLYEEALEVVDCAYITLVMQSPVGDVYFPCDPILSKSPAWSERYDADGQQAATAEGDCVYRFANYFRN